MGFIPWRLKPYTYDIFNRLTSFRDGATSSAYTYKADGLRLSKTVNGTKTTHVWDGSNIVLDLDNSDAVKDKYIRGINLIKNNSSYFLFNAHGDVVHLTDSAGAVTKRYHYDAFGNEVSPSAGDGNPWRYCGEYFDGETGTVYLRARYYDPRTGRFGTEDPVRDGLNWYTYCSNNPVAFIDPWGLEAYYIFYNGKDDKYNGSLKDRADKEYDALIKSGVDKSDIYIKLISSEKHFLEEWEKMDNGDNRIQRVALYLHSSPRGIIINSEKGQQIVNQLYVDMEGSNNGHKLITDLAQKDIYEITLYGCNTAHQDYVYNNIAYELINTQDKVSRVIGWDGSMRWSFWGGNPILAGKQEYFESWRNNVNPNSTRKPQGRVLYEKVWRLDDPSFPEYARQEILISPYKP